MPSIKRFLYHILSRVDNFIDAIKFRMVKVTGIGASSPIKVATYRGFGSDSRIFVQGRVLVKKSFKYDWQRKTIGTVLQTYQQFETDEVPNAKLTIEVGHNAYELQSDPEGYFTLDARLGRPMERSAEPWRTISIHLYETPWKKTDIRTTTTVLIPSTRAAIGVITDIDDTIIHTGVTSPLKWKVIYNTFFKSAERRKAFDEVGAFFQSLQTGSSGKDYNPVFYVSNSPYNLYERIKRFLKHNALPKGPLLLRDIGIPYRLHPLAYRGHKASSIIRILETYPDLRFILVGDSGEKDTYIYNEIANDFPDRIVAIFIRDVRSRRCFRKISKYLSAIDDSKIRIFENYKQAAELAEELDLLNYAQFEDFRIETARQYAQWENNPL